MTFSSAARQPSSASVRQCSLPQGGTTEFCKLGRGQLYQNAAARSVCNKAGGMGAKGAPLALRAKCGVLPRCSLKLCSASYSTALPQPTTPPKTGTPLALRAKCVSRVASGGQTSFSRAMRAEHYPSSARKVMEDRGTTEDEWAEEEGEEVEKGGKGVEMELQEVTEEEEGEEEALGEEEWAKLLAEEEAMLKAEGMRGVAASDAFTLSGAEEEWGEEELDELFDKYGRTLKAEEAEDEDPSTEEKFRGSSSSASTRSSSDVYSSVPTGENAGAVRAAPPSDEESEALALALAATAADTKAGDILVLDVRPLVYWTQFFVVATAYSRPQMDALAKRMSDVAEEKYGRGLKAPERVAPGPWTLLDYGDVVVHLFAPRERERYRIEEFYANARVLELPPEMENSKLL